MTRSESLRLRASVLVHRLTAGASGLTASEGPGTSSSPVEFVVHAFAPLDGPRRELAYQQVVRLWSACRRLLGTNDPIGETGVPADLPADTGSLPPGPVVAAQQGADRRAQAVLRRERDVLILSVGWRAGPGAPCSTWAESDETWAAIAAAGTDELLGVVRLHIGSTMEGGEAPREGWVVGGCGLWELPPHGDDARRERRILALAAPDRSREIGALTRWRGAADVAPLVRYLLDAAKVRYQLRVRLAAEASVRAAVAGDVSGADLTVLLSRLDDMRLTVEIARSNMDTVLRALDPRGAPNGLFEDDRRCAAWVESLLRDDVGYLTNAHRRIPRVTATPVPKEPVIGLVTALPEEFAAMASLIDGCEDRPAVGDPAAYVGGTLPSASKGRPHPVVLTLLTDTGNNWAATGVANMLRSFESIDQVLMVGVAAGVPAPRDPQLHVRLGDLVVATWGIVDYDHVVDRPGGVSLRQGFPQPSALLTQRVRALAADELGGRRPWEEELALLLRRLPDFARPDATTDRLYGYGRTRSREIRHPDPALSGHRDGMPKVHEGRIGSANRSLRNSARRDELAREYDLRAFEMEGSGIGSSAFAGGRDWLVVRGISDYGDQRLGRLWRPYASAVAAAYTRALLRRCPPITPHGGRVGGA